MSKPPQLAPFSVEDKQLHSKLLLDFWAPHPHPKGGPRHPVKEVHFSHLYPWSHPFDQYSQLMITGEGWNEDRPVNCELCLQAHFALCYDGLEQCSFYPHSWTRAITDGFHHWILALSPREAPTTVWTQLKAAISVMGAVQTPFPQPPWDAREAPLEVWVEDPSRQGLPPNVPSLPSLHV